MVGVTEAEQRHRYPIDVSLGTIDASGEQISFHHPNFSTVFRLLD